MSPGLARRVVWFGLAFLLLAPTLALIRLSRVVDGWLLLGLSFGLSLQAFLLHRSDKRRAETGAGRIPEATLHAAELIGGWPGALVAQRLFRHKTAKTSYQVVFWLIILLHQVVAFEYATGGWIFRRVTGAR